MKSKKIIIIGAGIAGMTAAVHLAKQGLDVTVVEKNSHPGGRCDHIDREGHTFDTGPTLLVMPLLYETEFTAMGANLRERVELQRVDPTYRLIFDDQSQLSLTSDLKSLQEQLEAFQPGSFQGILRYLEEGHRHYHTGMEKLVYPDFRSLFDFFKLSNIPLLYQVKPLSKHYAHMNSFVKDERLKAAFTFQDVYMGLSPFDAPATFSMMPYTELAHGVWYPRGGMYKISEAIFNLAKEAGVGFAFGADVERIQVEGKTARGVVINGELQGADLVLANADLPYVYQNLLPQSHYADTLAHKRYSCSAISFFWGVDRQYPALGPHTLFLAHDYRQNFESIDKDLTLPENPSLYIHAPARLDPAMAPEGQDTIVAVVPVGHMSADGNQDWTALRDQAREHVYRRMRSLGITDFADHVKFEMNFTPLSWKKRYNLVNGSTHGLCHNLTQLGYFRPDFHHPVYQNLYFTGASTRPGTGMPTAMISGRLAARRILDAIS